MLAVGILVTKAKKKKKKIESTPTSNEIEKSNEIDNFQTVNELWWIDFKLLNKYE